ncbi:hypothetical protein EDC01DRAFT_783241 [Geopyxis carbonaria]|nr:hypothetical protein EDC01DRAFT_783241 [Geopyxis carbonaria]
MNVTTQATAVPAIDAEHAATTTDAVPATSDDIDVSSPPPSTATQPRRAPAPPPIASVVAHYLEMRGPEHDDDHLTDFSTERWLEVHNTYRRGLSTDAGWENIVLPAGADRWLAREFAARIDVVLLRNYRDGYWHLDGPWLERLDEDE